MSERQDSQGFTESLCLGERVQENSNKNRMVPLHQLPMWFLCDFVFTGSGVLNPVPCAFQAGALPLSQAPGILMWRGVCL